MNLPKRATFPLKRTLATLTFALLLNSPWPPAEAAPVDSQQAAAAVTGWLALDRRPLGEKLGTRVQFVDTYSDPSGAGLYYVVRLSPAGFVIVAADDLVEPIVAFARAGRFDPSEANPLGALVKKDLSGRVGHARRAPAAATEEAGLRARARWRQLASATVGRGSGGSKPYVIVAVSDVLIAPLTQTTWDQETAAGMGDASCYNYYTPPYGAGNTANYPAGCVATAMAQLMRYYQFPTTSVGAQSFTTYLNGSATSTSLRGGDGAGGPYVWGQMPVSPASDPATVQCQAIGALLVDAGTSVGMDYGSWGSAADVLQAKTAFTSTFGYTGAVKGQNGGSDIGSGLVGMINPNLDARYPVLLGIDGSEGGHAIVADGYGYSGSTLYHHLNLGWSGADTAWYALPEVNTSEYTFTVVNGCVYNVFTNGSGEIISGRVLDQIGRPVVGAAVTATRTSGTGGTYTATTDTNGIYAVAGIPSASAYSIAVAKTNYSPVQASFSTLTSSDYAATSGNYWGADFTMPMLTTALDHLAWGTIGATQSAGAPVSVTLQAENLTDGAATGFTGPVSLSAYTSGTGASATILDGLTPSAWVYGSEMTLGYDFTPSTNVQVIAVRGYNTDLVSIWDGRGALLASLFVSASGSWVEAALTEPIPLAAGTTYRIGADIPESADGDFSTAWPSTFAYGRVGQTFYYAFGNAFPNSVYGTGEGPLVDLVCQPVFTNSVAVSPVSSGSFSGGLWSGTVTLGQEATNVVLEANDGAGHTGLSAPLTVLETYQLLAPQGLPGGGFQFSVSGPQGAGFSILASTDLVNWVVVTNFASPGGTVRFIDPATNSGKRFYRACGSP